MYVHVHMCVTELKALDPTIGLYTDIDENDKAASDSSKSKMNNSIHVIS